MIWYDIFSTFYDAALEHQYAPYRSQMTEALAAEKGDTLVDLACGTGQNFPYLLEKIGAEGLLIGLDASAGMLKRAGRRLEGPGVENARLLKIKAEEIRPAKVDQLTGGRPIDGVLCTLGLTAMDNWEAAFEASFDLLRPGGLFVICDVYARRRSLSRSMVEILARADLSREVWRPLETISDNYSLSTVELPRQFGGELVIARGEKARP